MKIVGSGEDYGQWPARRGGVEALPPDEQRLLWALRRLALMQPLGGARCHAVHVALQQDYGDAGQGLEHLLRCLLFGLSRFAPRRLAIGAPACPILTEDEAQLLLALRLAGGDETAAIAALVPLAGVAGAGRLVSFLATVGELVTNSHARGLSKSVQDISWRA
ncbi:hypothetical protein [Sandarakinorhabdus sp. DWP1-3-1]|uniref:hypothetical protein n=1 Tax=Sandarakinorhabdus sp. DWP1-3-1 TaxID=2804627 RepID=UPI003CEDB1D3